MFKYTQGAENYFPKTYCTIWKKKQKQDRDVEKDWQTQVSYLTQQNNEDLAFSKAEPLKDQCYKSIRSLVW